ncbi:MAG: amidase [Hyphomicrobiaceae bacterium]|nr:amidase [Hyphomicrobiaceae bacterium]
MSDDLGAFRLRVDMRNEAAKDGRLSAMTFAVKDVFDIAGLVTGGGNPDWLATHEPAQQTAPVVEMCLDAGAHLTGITISDELAFSLLGENAHYGTPINTAAPGRVPGGSSSGSASATAGGLVDFALGTDTAGSIRIPASYCGLYGLRPTHGRISLEGVMPLSRSFDTVGWVARDAKVLSRIGDVILGAGAEDVKSIRRILFLEEAFDLAEADARPALEAAVRQVSRSIAPIERVSLSKEGFADWLAAFNVLRPPEIWVTYGSWIEQVHPHFGPQVAQRFAAAKRAANADTRRAWVFRADKQDKAAALLGGDAVFILPTAPTIAPKIGLNDNSAAAQRENTIRLSCISPMLGLPEISIPLAVVDGCPIGLSLIAPKNADRMLLRAALDLSEAKQVPEDAQGRGN